MATVLAVLGQSVPVPAVFLLGVVMLLGLVYALASRRRNPKLDAFMASMPGPTPIPFIGTMYTFLEAKPETMCKFLMNHLQRYPKLAAHRWFDGQPIVFTGDLEISNALLASHQNIEKPPEYRVFENGAKGMISARGDTWRLMKNLLAPGFKTHIVGASFADNYGYHLRTFLDILDEYADDGEEHDVLMNVCACVLDLASDNFGETRMDLQKNHPHFSQLSKQATDMMYERIYNPLLRPDWMYSLLGKQKKFKEITRVGEALMQKILDERIEIRHGLTKINPTAERPKTLIEVLLAGVDSGAMAKSDALEGMLEISIAGTVSPAAIITGIMWFLSRLPDVQKKAYEEITETCTGDEVTLDDLPKLVYLEMICKETLRHFTAPVFGRQLVEDLKVNDELTIPKGVRVFLVTYIQHHNPEYWERPGEFYPEHFSDVNERKRPKGVFIPFLSGPRNCPGSQYAMQSLKMFIANTLLRYELWSHKKPPKDLTEEKYGLFFVLLPKEHAIQIKRRKRATACSD